MFVFPQESESKSPTLPSHHIAPSFQPDMASPHNSPPTIKTESPHLMQHHGIPPHHQQVIFVPPGANPDGSFQPGPPQHFAPGMGPPGYQFMPMQPRFQPPPGQMMAYEQQGNGGHGFQGPQTLPGIAYVQTERSTYYPGQPGNPGENGSGMRSSMGGGGGEGGMMQGNGQLPLMQPQAVRYNQGPGPWMNGEQGQQGMGQPPIMLGMPPNGNVSFSRTDGNPGSADSPASAAVRQAQAQGSNPGTPRINSTSSPFRQHVNQSQPQVLVVGNSHLNGVTMSPSQMGMNGSPTIMIKSEPMDDTAVGQPIQGGGIMGWDGGPPMAPHPQHVLYDMHGRMMIPIDPSGLRAPDGQGNMYVSHWRQQRSLGSSPSGSRDISPASTGHSSSGYFVTPHTGSNGSSPTNNFSTISPSSVWEHTGQALANRMNSSLSGRAPPNRVLSETASELEYGTSSQVGSSIHALSPEGSSVTSLPPNGSFKKPLSRAGPEGVENDFGTVRPRRSERRTTVPPKFRESSDDEDDDDEDDSEEDSEEEEIEQDFAGEGQEVKRTTRRKGPKVKAQANKLPNPNPDPAVLKRPRGRLVATDPTMVDSNVVHVCPIKHCGACFKRREHVKRHIRGLHTYEKPWPCKYPDCSKAFSRGDNLKAHYLAVHKIAAKDIDAYINGRNGTSHRAGSLKAR